MKKLLKFIRVFILFGLCFRADPSGIYFTPNRKTDQIIIKLIEKAEKSVYVAGYTMSWKDMMTKLIDRGGSIDVKIILDAEPPEKFPEGMLKVDEKSALFHPKFIIVDGHTVLVGSGNFTSGSLRSHHNNFLLIENPDVAEFFNKKFLCWWEGNLSEETYSDTTFRIYFSPENDCAAAIMDVLSSAVHSIRFAQYCFTSEDVVKAVIRRKLAGVKVYGIVERCNVEPYSIFYSLRNYGCVMKKSNMAGFLHDKFFIVDGEIVITGSYNPTASARRNTECLLIIKDKKTAGVFLKEWIRLWRYYSLP